MELAFPDGVQQSEKTFRQNAHHQLQDEKSPKELSIDPEIPGPEGKWFVVIAT